MNLENNYINEYKVYRNRVEELDKKIKTLKEDWNKRQDFFMKNGLDLKIANQLLKNYHSKVRK